jgi:hypothetical protein
VYQLCVRVIDEARRVRYSFFVISARVEPGAERGLFPVTRHRIATLRTFTADDWSTFGEALMLVVGVSIALRVVAFPRMLAWAIRMRPQNVSGACTPQQVERTAWLATRASRVARVKCLTRSLALARVLARRGVATDVRIGVKTDTGTLEAHAWVEHNGLVLNDRPHRIARYAAFDSARG